MEPLTVDLNLAGDGISITGQTGDVWRNRRASIFLRDYLHADLRPQGEILVPIRQTQIGPLLKSVEESLAKAGFTYRRGERISQGVADYQKAEEQFGEFSKRAQEIWLNKVPTEEFRAFTTTLTAKLPGRRLYDLQLLAAYHLAFAQNAANFSAPGVGKTTIVYGAFAYLNSLPVSDLKYVDKILVVGPLSAFGPWETEFKECFSRSPKSHRLSGGASPEYRKRVFYSELPEFRESELVLMSYQSVAHDVEHIRHFLTREGNRVMVVLDEAHKIKNAAGGVWAEAVLELARSCTARVVLTGTPAPNGYEDLFNLFHFIWPEHDVIKYHVQHLRDMSQNPFDPRIERLVDNVSPFFIRIRKSDLHLPAPLEHPPEVVPMGPKQDRIYRFIEEKYVNYFEKSGSESWLRDTLAKARLIRLMQAATNPALLRAPLDATFLDDTAERSPTLFVDDAEILSEIKRYESSEVPAKFLAALRLIKTTLAQHPSNRIVVWCVFVGNLFGFSDLLQRNNIPSRILFGGTPTDTDDSDPNLETREKIIREFQSPDCGYRVVVANPFAVGESISLHKACRYAIYIERNFNAAAFLQSKDRIHRYGLPDNAEVHYNYLISAETVDSTIHERLLEKEAAMMRVLESRTIPLINLNMESTEAEEDVDDVRAIIRDYVKRHSGNTDSR
jgi:SNF2 family DNA or RNA helicase